MFVPYKSTNGFKINEASLFTYDLGIVQNVCQTSQTHNISNSTSHKPLLRCNLRSRFPRERQDRCTARA